MARNTTSDMMIKKAYLLGQVGNALFQKDGRYFVISIEDKDPVPCQGREISLLSDVTSEYSLFTSESGITLEELRKRLRNLYYAYKALSFSLNGLDPAMEKSRGAVIQTANKLCQRDDKIYQFVRNRLLGYPFPLHNENEANKAIEVASGEAVKVKADRVIGIYKELSENWKRLQTFHEVIWKKVVPKFFADETEQVRALRFFVDKGVISELVTAATTQHWLTFRYLYFNLEKKTEFEDAFREELDIQHLQNLLEDLKDKFASHLWPTIFLAEVTDDLEERREKIRTSLENRNIRVIPEEIFLLAGGDIKSTIEQRLAYCKLFVQLLSDKKGNGYPKLQLECAKQVKIPILHWCDSTLATTVGKVHKIDVTKTTVTKFQDFQTEIIKQLVIAPVEKDTEFQTAILHKLKGEIDSAHNVIKVFINAVPDDLELGRKVKKVLEQNPGILCTLPSELRTRQTLEQDLTECDATIVIAPRNPNKTSYEEGWVVEQLRKCSYVQPQRSKQFKKIATLTTLPRNINLNLNLIGFEAIQVECSPQPTVNCLLPLTEILLS